MMKNVDGVVAFESDPFEFSAYITFSQDVAPLLINLFARGICPRLKITPKTVLSFGEVPVNEKKDVCFFIENKSSKRAVEFRFEKVAQFLII